MRNLITTLLMFTIGFTLLAQDSGDNVFNTDILHEVRLTFDQPNYWQEMINNFEGSPEGEVPYIMGHAMIDGEEVDSIGVRFKGFTSYTYDSDKKPIKLDFNEFVAGKRHDGLRKLNLNNSFGDASVQRDALCYNIMRTMGVKAPRTAHTRVYINDEYWGLYLLVEQVDKEFVQNNFTNDDGNLFKNKGWSHFEWNGTNDANYHPPFELKTNTDNPDWTGFVNLMDVLNNGSISEIETAFASIFNIDLFLKVLAVDVATNNWDSYLEHGRNWYIYEDNIANMFHWIPWDYNFALGGTFDFGGSDDCEIFPNFYEVRDGSTTVEFYQDAFSFGSLSYAWDFGDGNTSSDANPIHTYAIAGLYNVCVNFIQDDNCMESFCKNVNTEDSQADCSVILDGSCPHPFGSTFVQTLNFDPSCCSNWTEGCEEIYGFLTNNGGGNGFSFSIDQRENQGVLINRLLNNPTLNERYYIAFCDLLDNVMTEEHLFPLLDETYNLINASVIEDPNFLYQYSAFEEISGTGNGSLKKRLTDRIETLHEELEQIYTCPEVDEIVESGSLVINEMLASSDEASGISDTDAEFDDWIELYNNTEQRINLSGLYLSDNIAEPLKWKFPYGTILDSDDYLIIWADEDSIQFGLHSNFKLPKSGGQIVLSNSDGTTIDQVDYPEQTTNIAYARIPNGTGSFVKQLGTHAYNNEIISSNNEINSLAANIYPIPVNTEINIELSSSSSAMKVRLFSLDGRVLLDRQLFGHQTTLDVSQIINGSYILDIIDSHGKKLKEHVVIMR